MKLLNVINAKKIIVSGAKPTSIGEFREQYIKKGFFNKKQKAWILDLKPFYCGIFDNYEELQEALQEYHLVIIDKKLCDSPYISFIFGYNNSETKYFNSEKEMYKFLELVKMVTNRGFIKI